MPSLTCLEQPRDRQQEDDEPCIYCSLRSDPNQADMGTHVPEQGCSRDGDSVGPGNSGTKPRRPAMSSLQTLGKFLVCPCLSFPTCKQASQDLHPQHREAGRAKPCREVGALGAAQSSPALLASQVGSLLPCLAYCCFLTSKSLAAPSPGPRTPTEGSALAWRKMVSHGAD